MKKVIAAAVVAIIMMLSVVPVFASVDSPVATTKPENGSGTSTVIVKDNYTVSPKTGSSDVALFSVIALAVVGCGTAAFALTRSGKKKQ